MGIYKDGKLAGVYTITDVVPTHQARLLLWAWGSWFAGDAVREIKKYIEDASQEYGLKRVYAQTPDRKQIRLLGIVGFSEEGRFKRAYQFGSKLYKLYQTRMLIGG
jgi:RimJ/RimL family protein N-acetyltransferase